ncbi:MAG TPA: hypothetical protein VIH19_05860 [Candidatus Limnocylindria bacterium]
MTRFASVSRARSGALLLTLLVAVNGIGLPVAAAPPTANCPLFPSTNVWNKRVDSLPVAANSDALINAIGRPLPLHPDFGEYLGYGIPYNVVDSTTPRKTVAFDYDDESDHVPYPIPGVAKIEGGSDRHMLMWDTEDCRLYELFNARKTASGWRAGSGATWDLNSNALRPNSWTSADAAGLPILPGLVRREEVMAGAILHAIRFTAPRTRSSHIYPARHHAGAGSCGCLPPMGLRVRLKKYFDVSDFSPRMQVILRAMKRYGMILADNGSPWFFSGTSDVLWNDDELNELKSLHGRDFEVVNTSSLRNG